MEKKVKIFQIYFDEDSRKYLHGSFIPVFNPPPQDGSRELLFENAILERVYNENHEDAHFLGVTSWKVSKVLNHCGETLIQRITQQDDKDVVLYCPKIAPAYSLGNAFTRFKERSERSESAKAIYQLIKVIDSLGILPHDLDGSEWVYNYRNYWVARKQVFDDFVSNWIIPLNKEFRERKKIFNFVVDYRGRKYAAQPFVMELLIGAYLAKNKNLTFAQL
jgi:hypothetical protein